MGFAPWQAATRCVSGPQPGALALMRWIIEEYGDQGAYNLGIFNCRTVRGGSTTSCHGEGRALDVGFPVGDPDGNKLLKELLSAPGRLGLQAIIYERRIYSALSPDGRAYTGVNPHYDHLHIEQTREAADKLTYATVFKVLHKGLPRHFRGTRALHEGMEGTDVKWVQRKLDMVNLDGVYGPRTASAVQRFEEAMADDYPRLVIDGNVGAVTWKALGVTPKLKAAEQIMVDDVSLGELARITSDAVSRIEHMAERLESGQFVRTDIFDRSEKEIVRSISALEMDAHRLEENKAGKDALARVADGLAVLVTQTAYDDLLRRVNSLESTNVWLVRTVIGFIILAVLGLVVMQGGRA